MKIKDKGFKNLLDDNNFNGLIIYPNTWNTINKYTKYGNPHPPPPSHSHSPSLKVKATLDLASEC